MYEVSSIIMQHNALKKQKMMTYKFVRVASYIINHKSLNAIIDSPGRM